MTTLGRYPPRFRCRLARNDADIVAVQRLRYDVFVNELGGDGPLVDHVAGRETDRFDAHADHLMLFDDARCEREGDPVIGVYRIIDDAAAEAAGHFYSEDEFDLTPLKSCGRRLLELGRSCLHLDYRGGTAMMHLWSALADIVADRNIEILFGVASFHGVDTARLAAPLAMLHHRHLAPPALRVRARPPNDLKMDLLAAMDVNRVAAMRETPALIKAYLRLGGCVGSGAYVDRAFNTTDVCLILDTAQLKARQHDLYRRNRT